MDLYESEATLVYELSSRTATATQKNTVLRKRNNNNKPPLLRQSAGKLGRVGRDHKCVQGFFPGDKNVLKLDCGYSTL